MKQSNLVFKYKQVIDGELTSFQRDIIGECINNELVYEYDEEGKRILMRFLVEDENVLIRLHGDNYQAIIPMELNQKTEGKYIIQGKELIFGFYLKKIVIKRLAIYLEYDIFTKDSVISNNTWEIEVK